MRPAVARFALIDPEPVQFCLLVAESETGPAWFEVIPAEGKDGWGEVVRGRVAELAPGAQSIEEIGSATN